MTFQTTLPANLQMSISGQTESVAAETSTADKKLLDFCRHHKLNAEITQDLKSLKEWDIVFVCDDSGSMNTIDKGNHHSRWHELKEVMSFLIKLATCVDSDGPDLYFLNQEKRSNVKTEKEVHKCFENRPSGGTPLSGRVKEVIKDKYEYLGADRVGKKLLIVIATDGMPSDKPTTQESIKDFKKLIKNRNGTTEADIKQRQNDIRIGIMPCTDDDAAVGYLNELDEVSGVDVVDDFKSEKAQSMKNTESYLTREQWAVKPLLGPISSKYDKIDG